MTQPETLIGALLKETQDGHLTWKQVLPDHWEAELGEARALVSRIPPWDRPLSAPRDLVRSAAPDVRENWLLVVLSTREDEEEPLLGVDTRRQPELRPNLQDLAQGILGGPTFQTAPAVGDVDAAMARLGLR